MAQHIMVGKSDVTRASFMDVLKPHYGLLKQSALKYCNYDEPLSEDMLQESIMKAYANLDKFSGGNFGGWMYRILHNTIISYYRHRHGEVNFDYRPMCDINGNNIGITGDIASHFDELASHDQQRDVFAADRINQSIENLPDYLKLPFKMAAVDGMEYKQVAKKLNVPIGTVMSRIFRARMALQRKLKPLVVED